MYTLVMANENANIVAAKSQNIVATSLMMLNKAI